jgi:hypothetical protein
MDWLTFITKLVEALVWPAVVLVVLWLGRSRIAGLFDVFPTAAKTSSRSFRF